MRSRIDALEAALAGKTGTGDEDLPSEEMLDEIPEELRENAAKAKDSAYFTDSFKDTVAQAEILVPGIRIPTFDGKAKPGQTFKAICSLRRQALDLAYGQPATHGVLDDLLAGQTLNTKDMTCDAIRTLFRSAASVQRTNNNSGRGTSVADTNPTGKKVGVTSLAELNRINSERFKNV